MHKPGSGTRLSVIPAGLDGLGSGLSEMSVLKARSDLEWTRNLQTLNIILISIRPE